ncbi:hypothetical protein EfmGK923_28600 (plasmid) [Enterococcus faecium]|nr:hypothetical protein EfmGK923_28600 [Enterococcus faecium]
MKYLFDFVFAIKPLADVVCSYLCKWLDCKIAKRDSKAYPLIL